MAGIYIHIPFCRSKCAYCDFYSMPQRDRAEGYVRALINEWQERRSELDEQVTTIYLGGGTPSSLPLPLLDEITGMLPCDEIEEMTIEVNPEDVDADFCHWLQLSPVNRVSMGIQSLDDTQLALVGRRHTASEAIEAVERLRDCGVGNLSLDLIYGLPGQSLDSWEMSLRRLLQLNPEHLSAYLLSYEPGTRLSAMLAKGKVTECSEELAEKMYGLLCDLTAEAGFDHYEISNFARQGYRARHNSAYWTMTPYLGLGPAAHSFTGGKRRYNPSDLKSYLTSAGRGITVVEQESLTEIENDRIITALRTADGLPLEALSPSTLTRVEKSARRWLDSGVLLREGNRLRVNPSHWLICDRVLIDLIDVDDDE